MMSNMMTIFPKFGVTDLKNELNTLREKVGHLVAQKSDIQKEVENAEVQPGQKRKREVEWWFERVEEKKRELQRIEDELEMKCPCRELNIKIKNETKEVQQRIQQGKSFRTVVLYDHSCSRLEMVETNLVGSCGSKNVEMIIKWLQDDDVYAIGVNGMGGVGKTTLLKKINNILLKDSNIRGQVYWVTASQDCNLEKLQISIGKCLNLDLAKEDDEKRRSSIFHTLSGLQKSVVIIDDMWDYFSADQIGIPSRGCKIIITTRLNDVCRKMRCQKVIKVSPLLAEDAWSLFAENSGEVPNAVVPLARGIVEECAGLPLALITMGCCMREVTDVHEWNNTLCELKRPTSQKDDMEERVFKILKCSFDGLNDENVQNCFLSCVLFPEDEKIERDALINLWIMEGLLDDKEDWEKKVNKGHTILNRLESSSLLESSQNGKKQK